MICPKCGVEAGEWLRAHLTSAHDVGRICHHWIEASQCSECSPKHRARARREGIAKLVLTGFATGVPYVGSEGTIAAQRAVEWADLLIAELDRGHE